MIEMIVTSSVVILAILAIRRVSRGRISMKLRYSLWFVAVVRLLLPVPLGDSAVSVMNLLPADWQQTADIWSEEDDSVISVRSTNGAQTVEAGNVKGAGDNLPAADGQIPQKGQNLTAAEQGSLMMQGDANNKDTVTTGEKSKRDEQAQGIGDEVNKNPKVGAGRIRGMLFALWMLGALAVGGYLTVNQVRFGKILHQRRSEVSEKQIPQMFTDRFTRQRIKVYQVDGLASPCLVGRDIYIETKLIREQQKFTHVLAHEYCHARQHDTLWAFLRSALVALYWFHPLVWAAAFAAKQDSELACDEAVIQMLGEKERFSYGRTLLYLLSEEKGQIDCAGTVLTMEGRKHGVRERVRMIARTSDRKRGAAAVVLIVMLLICGCAFTGSSKQSDILGEAENEQMPSEEGAHETFLGQADNRQALNEEPNAEFERIQDEYEAALKVWEQTLLTQQEQAFLSVLDYQGVMAGKDDSELFLNRKVDQQGYYEFLAGERDNPLEDGWYLLCRNEGAQISLYGLYTQEFGFRGIKTLIGEDVNTYDMPWCSSAMNEFEDNIRVLEEAEDGLPRRFVFKILSENTSDKERWNLYSAIRYDTGTVEVEELTAEMYYDWVEQNFSFTVDDKNHIVQVTYDEDMVLEPLDISPYQNLNVEKVRLSPDVVTFELNSEAYEKEEYEESGYEGIVIYLAVGLQLEGMEDVWISELAPLVAQVVCRQGQEPGFMLQHPKIDSRVVLHSLTQSRKLEEILKNKEQDGKTDGEADHLSIPLVNSENNHHDLEIIFQNPCPDYDRISDAYGERTNPLSGEVKKHNGVDMAAPEGADIVAAADGTVFETGFDATNGNYVVLWHEQSGQMTYYMHCKEVLVAGGDRVGAGDKIATVGKTGRATGNFLHFAVSYNGEWEEPLWE